jgi:hypothetical protein
MYLVYLRGSALLDTLQYPYLPEYIIPFQLYLISVLYSFVSFISIKLGGIVTFQIVTLIAMGNSKSYNVCEISAITDLSERLVKEYKSSREARLHIVMVP